MPTKKKTKPSLSSAVNADVDDAIATIATPKKKSNSAKSDFVSPTNGKNANGKFNGHTKSNGKVNGKTNGKLKLNGNGNGHLYDPAALEALDDRELLKVLS